MTRKYKHKKNHIEPKVVFVFDDTQTTEKDYDDFVVSYIALLRKWDRRRQQKEKQKD